MLSRFKKGWKKFIQPDCDKFKIRYKRKKTQFLNTVIDILKYSCDQS